MECAGGQWGIKSLAKTPPVAVTWVSSFPDTEEVSILTAISHRVMAVQESPRLDRDHKQRTLAHRSEMEAIVVADGTVKSASDAAITLDTAERRLLARMPLHAITSVHGEAGLRERLLMEIARFPAADRTRAGDALALASQLHARDRRQREPYANHVLRVTIRILSHYRVTDPNIACAALLHDAVEDHAQDIASDGTRQAAFTVLARQFGERTAGLVAAVTNPAWQPGRDEHEQYRAHVTASLQASPWARIIKVSDITDNAVGLIHTTGPKLSRLASKYRPLVPVLREFILRPDTPLDPDVKNMIARQLDNAEDRFAAISHDDYAGNSLDHPPAARPGS